MKTSTTESEKTTGSRYKVKSKKAPISITKTNDTVNYTQGGGASIGSSTQGFVPKGNMQLKDNSIQSSKNTTVDTTV